MKYLILKFAFSSETKFSILFCKLPCFLRQNYHSSCASFLKFEIISDSNCFSFHFKINFLYVLSFKISLNFSDLFLFSIVKTTVHPYNNSPLKTVANISNQSICHLSFLDPLDPL